MLKAAKARTLHMRRSKQSKATKKPHLLLLWPPHALPPCTSSMSKMTYSTSWRLEDSVLNGVRQ